MRGAGPSKEGRKEGGGVWQPWTDPENRASSVTTCHRRQRIATFVASLLPLHPRALAHVSILRLPETPQSTARLAKFVPMAQLCSVTLQKYSSPFYCSTKSTQKLILIPILQKHEICKNAKLLNNTLFCKETFMREKELLFLQRYQASHPSEVKYEKDWDAMHCSIQVLREGNFLLSAPWS